MTGNVDSTKRVCIDPDLPCEEVREPFRTLPIKFLNIPMDFRMDFSTLAKMLADVKPKYVMCSSFYTKPLIRRPDLQISYEKVWPIEYDECVQLSKLSRNKQKLVTVSVHPDVVANLKFKQHPTRKVAIASVECNLSAYNDDFKLIPTNSRIVKRKYGRMTLAKVLKEMKNRNLDVVEVKGKGETVLEIQEMDAKITVKNDGTRTKITANDSETRQKLLEILRSLLVDDDGIVGRRLEGTPSPFSKPSVHK
ncbi:hypothetical protein CRE_09328 [Caenorhabditis remanei]|uniref:Uncharacterized protein n=1 Tax=Caenorhabditis remanei TaxID=31234 RepID=E3LI62_CAERE|nr:hypothetical protein CRE_09328 [Caenorhabditis remanei]